MKEAGFSSETVVTSAYDINKNTDEDIIIAYKYRGLPQKMPIAFIVALHRYDLFFMSFNEFLRHASGLRFEMILPKLAGKKVVLLPYGGDSYVYSKVHSPLVAHGLMMSYPGLRKEQVRLDKRVRTWTSLADVVLPGRMAFDGFGRWGVLQPSY